MDVWCERSNKTGGCPGAKAPFVWVGYRQSVPECGQILLIWVVRVLFKTKKTVPLLWYCGL